MYKYSIVLCLIPAFLGAQEIKTNFWDQTALFAEASIYRHTRFEDNIFTEGEIGVGFFTSTWVSPEISLAYTLGSIHQEAYANEFQLENFPVAILETQFDTFTIAIGTKFSFFKRDERIWWTFLPKFHYGSNRLQSGYNELDDSAAFYRLIEFQENSKNIRYFSFGLGIEGYITESEKFSLGFAIKYTTLSINDQLQNIEFSTPNISVANTNTQTLGVALKFYFFPFKKEAL
ncbi:hypothetical protein J8281_01255 [Aquimarina sp. U1-2]|uniref:hypothetical protein n=1 Tax=Aquimarina sp. U1-2 TaxID=2823141 RepID=UPI001AECC48F|nr:hypothetical protein [Aquimarina sp. U1-2]MBP2830800.1 hypothetical protein [Aquimarina sp. U1-2]